MLQRALANYDGGQSSIVIAKVHLKSSDMNTMPTSQMYLTTHDKNMCSFVFYDATAHGL